MQSSGHSPTWGAIVTMCCKGFRSAPRRFAETHAVWIQFAAFTGMFLERPRTQSFSGISKNSLDRLPVFRVRQVGFATLPEVFAVPAYDGLLRFARNLGDQIDHGSKRMEGGISVALNIGAKLSEYSVGKRLEIHRHSHYFQFTRIIKAVLVGNFTFRPVGQAQRSASLCNRSP